MLKSIKYVATFNSTGRSLKNHIHFKPGLTIIRGENEAGKSFVLEMIRYALFGSDALRGNRSGYDVLNVTLVIEIRGKTYSITREGNKAKVNKNEAVGTKAVNAYIQKLLGYGLAVFDVTQNVKQGELDKLTQDMGPTERRKVIDQVTGLSQFELAEKDCRSEANTLRKVAEALEGQLVEPIEPIKPEDYEDSKVLKERLDKEIENRTRKENFIEMEKPVAPVAPAGSATSIEHEDKRTLWLEERNKLEKKLELIPADDYGYTHEQLRKFQSYFIQESRGPQPSGYDEQTLEGWRHDNLKLANSEEPITCPECGAIIEGEKLPEKPPLSLSEIQEEVKRHNNWAGFEYDDTLTQPPITSQEVEEALDSLVQAFERTMLLKQIKDMGSEPEDCSLEAQQWSQYLSDYEIFTKEFARYHSYLPNKAEIDALPEPEPYLSERYDMSLRYETLKQSFDDAKLLYNEQKARLDTVSERREHYKSGATALKEARMDVKQYLVPSLNRVASHLLYQMTDGERKSIKVSEDFDIVVDNQPVGTLSGSGISIVNLALRIALGQVLTQAVTPFLLADEVDANMGERRVKATHESLKKLRDSVDQIIVVTHKELEGDYEICLT